MHVPLIVRKRLNVWLVSRLRPFLWLQILTLEHGEWSSPFSSVASRFVPNLNISIGYSEENCSACTQREKRKRVASVWLWTAIKNTSGLRENANFLFCVWQGPNQRIYPKCINHPSDAIPAKTELRRELVTSTSANAAT